MGLMAHPFVQLYNDAVRGVTAVTRYRCKTMYCTNP